MEWLGEGVGWFVGGGVVHGKEERGGEEGDIR